MCSVCNPGNIRSMRYVIINMHAHMSIFVYSSEFLPDGTHKYFPSRERPGRDTLGTHMSVLTPHLRVRDSYLRGS